MRIGLLVVFLVVSHARLTQADEGLLRQPRARQGYFFGATLAATRVDPVVDDDPQKPLLSPAFGARMGQMATPWLGFGLEVNFASIGNGKWSGRLGGLLVDLQLAPIEHLAVHLGAGAGTISVNRKVAPDEDAEGTGSTYYSAALTWDWFPLHERGESGGFSLTPRLQVLYLPGDEVHAFAYLVAIDITWWSGLPKHMLELPQEEAYGPAEPWPERRKY